MAIAEARVDFIVNDLKTYWKSSSKYSSLQGEVKLQTKIVVWVGEKKYPIYMVLDKRKTESTRYYCVMGKNQ